MTIERRGDAEVQAATRIAAAWSSAPITIRSGWRKSCDRGALAEELGVRHDVHVGAAQHPLDDLGRPDRHGRLVDDDRLRRRGAAPISAAGRLDVAEVGGRRPHPAGSARRGTRTRTSATAAAPPDDEAQAAVVETLARRAARGPSSTIGTSAAARRVDPLGVDVGAHHVVAEVGEASRRWSGRRSRHRRRRSWPWPGTYRPAATIDRVRAAGLAADPCRRVSGVDG